MISTELLLAYLKKKSVLFDFLIGGQKHNKWSFRIILMCTHHSTVNIIISCAGGILNKVLQLFIYMFLLQTLL